MCSVKSWGEGRISKIRTNHMDLHTIHYDEYRVEDISTSAHGVNSNRRLLCNRFPITITRRDIGRGKRLCTRVYKVQDVRAVFTLFYSHDEETIKFQFKKNKRIKESDSSNNNNNTSDSNINNIKEDNTDFKKDILHTLATDIIFTLNFYIPHSYIIHNQKLNGHTCFRRVLHRLDIINLIQDRDRDILLTALSSISKGYTFYDTASTDEVNKSEFAWDFILSWIFGKEN